MAVAITTVNDEKEMILPSNEFMQFEHAEGKWARVPGYNSVSPEIVLSLMFDPISVEAGGSRVAPMIQRTLGGLPRYRQRWKSLC